MTADIGSLEDASEVLSDVADVVEDLGLPEDVAECQRIVVSALRALAADVHPGEHDRDLRVASLRT